MLKLKNIFFIALLTLSIYVGMGQCEFGKSLKYAKSPSGEELICIYKFGMLRNCYPKVFKPTHEYQVILEGQEIPKGLDVQISMKTGERRAKLPDNYEPVQTKREIEEEEKDPKIQKFEKSLEFLKKLQNEQVQKYEEYIRKGQFQKALDVQEYQEYLKQKEIQQQQDYQDYLNNKHIQEIQQRRRYQEYQNFLKQKQQSEQSEPQQPHEIVMVNNDEEEEKVEEVNETHQKVKIHTGKYKSSESPYVENPVNDNNDNDNGSSSSDSDDDEENDNVVKIHYQDKVSYTEAFGSLSKAKTLEEKIEFLEQLEDIVHHIEFGQELMKNLPEFINYLKDENSKIRALSAICIGSSLQNNPKARKTAIKQHLYDILIERLTNEEDINVLKRLCYAFSNLVRGDTKMIKKLHNSKNLGLLYHLYMNQPSLRNKLEAFVTDVFDSNKMKEGTNLNDFIDKDSANLWCMAFQNNIISEEGYLSDLIYSLSILVDTHECSNINPNLRPILQNLSKTQPELFEEASHDLNSSIQKILEYQEQQSQPQKPFKEL